MDETDINTWKSIAIFISMLFSALAFFFSIIAYRNTNEWRKADNIRQTHENISQYINLVLNSKDLQDEIAMNHQSVLSRITGSETDKTRFGRNDVVKMFRYFILLNIMYSSYEAKRHKLISDYPYETQMKNFAHITFSDRIFIEKHVLARGYPEEFCCELKLRWGSEYPPLTKKDQIIKHIKCFCEGNCK